MEFMNNEIKKMLGDKAASFVQDGMILGLGTGTTARFFTEAVGELCRKGMKLKACATSVATTKLAMLNKIPIISINKVNTLDLIVDGCDEFDPQKRMIKGRGGALLREKILANLAKEMIVICTSEKRRTKLGEGILPVEVDPIADQLIQRQIEALGFSSVIRAKNNISYITDNKNHIIDINLPKGLKNPEKLNQTLINIPGILETGFFFNLASKILIGNEDKTIDVIE
ncbi:ribose-5-phosphate isomerase RpiA [Chlamydiales bacterium]|nr:ribose-5-phosphate isomerase RpiA [Chlamydiales bacterium]